MNTPTDPSLELSVTRTYNAPRDLILKLWSDPAHITNWWGPIGFTTTTHEMDFRPGGIWRFTMHGPDGKDWPNLVHYEVTGPDVIRYLHEGEDGGVHFHARIDLVEVSEKETQVTFCMTFPSQEIRDEASKHGAGQGLYDTTSRLAQKLQAEQSEEAIKPRAIAYHKEDPAGHTLVLSREFSFGRPQLWEALIDPAIQVNWLPFRSDRRLDSTGPVTLTMLDSEDGEVLAGEVKESVAAETLTFTWGDDILRWRLSDNGRTTRLTLSHTASDITWLPKVAAGWDVCLHSLDLTLQGKEAPKAIGAKALKHGWKELHTAYCEILDIEDKSMPLILAEERMEGEGGSPN